MLYQIGEAVLVNKWSHSLYLNEVYLPEQNLFPKQKYLLREYCILGIVLEASFANLCLVWIPEVQKKLYFSYEDIKKCQD